MEIGGKNKNTNKNKNKKTKKYKRIKHKTRRVQSIEKNRSQKNGRRKLRKTKNKN
jgi:hypothetical protein